MKLLHCADINLDSRMMTSLSREQINIRKMEMLRTFSRMVDYADSNGIPVILISGNLFDSRNIAANIRSQVMDLIVSHPHIDFLYLQGCGKRDNFLSRVEEIPGNLLLFGKEWKTYSYGKITVSGIELEELPDGSAGLDPLYNGLQLQRDAFNILMLQGPVGQIRWQRLKNRYVDYVAAGGEKNYSFSQLDARGYYAYPGCLEGRDFSENDEHGFIVINVEEDYGRPSFGFVPIAARNHYTIPVDITDVITTQEAVARIEKILAEGEYSSASLLRIVLCGKMDINSTVNRRRLTEQYQQSYFYAEFADETELVVNYSDFEKDASLRGEFIRTVLLSELPNEKKMEIIRCGVDLLAGEEL